MANNPSGIGNAVLDYLQKNRNVEVSLNDMENDLPFDRMNIASTISHLGKNWDIYRPSKGWYIFKGAKKSKDEKGTLSVKAKAQVVSILQDDRLLVEVDGYLYVATPLEI